VARFLIAAALLVIGTASPALAADPPPLIPVFNGWTFSDMFPGVQQQATEAYHAMGPIAWLVIGGFLAAFVIDLIIRIVRAAAHGPDED
jgi:hypothetical protein